MPIGLGGTAEPTHDPTTVGVLTLQPTDTPSALAEVQNTFMDVVYDLTIEQKVQAVTVTPARRATFVGKVPFTPIPGSLATQFFYSKNSDVAAKARVDTNATLNTPARRRLLGAASSAPSVFPSQHVLLDTAAPSVTPDKAAAAEWYVQLYLRNASYQNTSFDLVEFSATDVPVSTSAHAFVLFRKRPGYPDIFCVSESDMANSSYVRLGAARGHACATFSQAEPLDGLSFRSFGISPFAFRSEESTTMETSQLCSGDNAPQMVQVFALGCNVTWKGDVVCDVANPSRFVLLRVSCDGHVEKLRVKDDTVVLSPVACIVEGRLEPSDLFCRDPTSAHQLLGPHPCSQFAYV